MNRLESIITGAVGVIVFQISNTLLGKRIKSKIWCFATSFITTLLIVAGFVYLISRIGK